MKKEYNTPKLVAEKTSSISTSTLSTFTGVTANGNACTLKSASHGNSACRASTADFKHNSGSTSNSN